MAHRLAWIAWYLRVGVCAAIAVVPGCRGRDSLTGTGGRVGGSTTGDAGAADGQSGGSSGTGGVDAGAFGSNVDILFMIDNSSEMNEMQQKLYLQLPSFIETLQSLPTPLSLHLAVVDSDLGAPGDSTTSIMCTTTGDNGAFQSAPRSNVKLTPPINCTDSTLAIPAGQTNNDHTFISDADGITNYTDPDLSAVLQCIAFLGDSGCGFEHQLASIDHALGADNLQPDPSDNLVPTPPASNVGFLRPNAYLVIILLTNEDDCSAPPNTQLYSLKVGGSNEQNIANALGPIANYRCNEFGHLCRDAASNNPTAFIEPPLNPPADAQGTATAPTLDLADCESNDVNGLLTPVAKFVNDIKMLKPDPDNQILVAAIAGPATPYTVAWAPEVNGQNTQPGELWPEVMHSCGAAGGYVNPEAQISTDGSFADPSVRINQFVSAFPNNVLGSVCDPSYASALGAVAGKIGEMIGQMIGQMTGHP